MGPVEIIILVVVGVAFFAALGVIIYKKVKHKGSCCGCDCGCSGCYACPQDKVGEAEKK